MSDSSSLPVDVPAELNPAPIPPSGDSGEVKESTTSHSSAPEASRKSGPFETGLPEEDAEELAWHKATLIAEEDIRERVTIPTEFLARQLWSPFSSLSDPPSSVLSANVVGHITFPPVVLARARAALANAFSSSSQLSSVPPRPGRTPQPSSGNDSEGTGSSRESSQSPGPLTEPVVTLFCPFDHTAGVIDTLVRSIALGERADVLVLDALMFPRNKDLGPVLENTLQHWRTGNDEFKSRQIQRYLHAMINVELPGSGDGVDASMRATAAGLPQESAADISMPESNSTDNFNVERPRSGSIDGNSVATNDSTIRPRPRIIYLKDFGAIASHGRSFLRELILAVRSRRTALQPISDSDEPYDVRKIQPTVIILGVSHSPENPPHKCCPTHTWSTFVDGFRKSDYERLCELCPQIDQAYVAHDTKNITDVLGGALLATRSRARYANATSDNPNMGHGAIYRRVIVVHGFFDSRDRAVGPKQVDKGEQEPDQDLWRKGEAVTQKERKEEFASLQAERDERRGDECLAANEEILRKALAHYGGKLQGGFGVLGALPERNPTAGDTAGKNKSKKKTEELEAEKYATLSGLRSNELPQALADHIAALALYGLPSKSGTPESKASSTSPSSGASPSPSSLSTKIEQYVVSPEDIATAIAASVHWKRQSDQWLDNYEKLWKRKKDCEDEDEDEDCEDKDEEEDKDRKEDPVVAKVRSSDNLNRHEKRLLGCIIDTTQLNTRFEDVCIEPKIIEGVRTIISLPLMHPAAFATGVLSREGLSGILLYGPPGTGKTMLCRAIAKECNVRMLLIAPSDVENCWVGETEKLIAGTFSLARKVAPCVIFIDEVDAIFGTRGNGSRYHRSMLTQFMQEMDGLKSAVTNKKKGIVVIGATNRPFDLDDAILRRLPRRMLVDLPGLKERERILKVHLKGEVMEGVDVAQLAQRADNYSGSDLKNLTVSAALESLKDVIPETWVVKKKQTAEGVSGDGSNEEEGGARETGIQAGEDAGASDDGQEEDTFELSPRVIRSVHFDAAFEQVSATCSKDMASVQQLRSWAKKFSRNSSL